MEIQNCIWTKQCAADSLSGHWKVWKDSKSKSSDPPWSAKQGFLQLWQKVVDKCKLSSLSHYCHHFDWYPLSKVWPLFVVGWWFHKDDNDDYDDDIVGAKGSTQRDELPRDDDVTGLVGKYHQRPPSYSITKMITVLAKMCCGWGCWWKQYRSHSSGAQITSRLQSRSWPKWPPWPTWTSCQSKLKLKSGKIWTIYIFSLFWQRVLSDKDVIVKAWVIESESGEFCFQLKLK